MMGWEPVQMMSSSMMMQKLVMLRKRCELRSVEVIVVRQLLVAGGLLDLQLICRRRRRISMMQERG